MKNPNGQDLPVCSTVPQPTAQPQTDIQNIC